MAEITKLSVGQAIDKLRGTDAPKAKMARLITLEMRERSRD
jgi:hypothetical protein